MRRLAVGLGSPGYVMWVLAVDQCCTKNSEGTHTAYRSRLAREAAGQRAVPPGSPTRKTVQYCYSWRYIVHTLLYSVNPHLYTTMSESWILTNSRLICDILHSMPQSLNSLNKYMYNDYDYRHCAGLGTRPIPLKHHKLARRHGCTNKNDFMDVLKNV